MIDFQNENHDLKKKAQKVLKTPNVWLLVRPVLSCTYREGGRKNKIPAPHSSLDKVGKGLGFHKYIDGVSWEENFCNCGAHVPFPCPFAQGKFMTSISEHKS